MSNAGPIYERPLYTLLYDRLTHVDGIYTGGRLDARCLANKIKVHRYTVYRWLSGDLSVQGARKLIELSEGRISQEELTPFILG